METANPPRAILHKRILDVAESNPDVSMAEIADQVSGASVDMVETVLEEYGDPVDELTDEPGIATNGTSPSDRAAPEEVEEPDSTSSEGIPETPDPSSETDEVRKTSPEQDTEANPHDEAPAPASDRDDLTDDQLKALRLIHERPNASQGELAEEFDVTRTTVNRWVNDIPGFEWNRRQEIVAQLLNGELGVESSSADQPAVDRLRDRIDHVEARINETDPRTTELDPDLVHKIMHACLQSERISDDEELAILKALMASPK